MLSDFEKNWVFFGWFFTHRNIWANFENRDNKKNAFHKEKIVLRFVSFKSNFLKFIIA
jgi:hypothetical protein